MIVSEKQFIFSLDNFHYAISLSLVNRVIRAVEVTPVSAGSGSIIGIINLHGLIVPVINTRQMMGLPEREIVPDDLFIIVNTPKRTLALAADAIEPMAELPEGIIIPNTSVLPEAQSLSGIAKLDDGVVLIHDLEQCLENEYSIQIENVIAETSSL